jgi:hypothetical protein
MAGMKVAGWAVLMVEKRVAWWAWRKADYSVGYSVEQLVAY